MTSLLIHFANLILRRWDRPVTEHPGLCRCIRCHDHAYAYLAGVTDTLGYGAIRQGREPDMRALEALRAGYRGSES